MHTSLLDSSTFVFQSFMPDKSDDIIKITDVPSCLEKVVPLLKHLF